MYVHIHAFMSNILLHLYHISCNNISHYVHTVILAHILAHIHNSVSNNIHYARTPAMYAGPHHTHAHTHAHSHTPTYTHAPGVPHGAPPTVPGIGKCLVYSSCYLHQTTPTAGQTNIMSSLFLIQFVFLFLSQAASYIPHKFLLIFLIFTLPVYISLSARSLIKKYLFLFILHLFYT